MREQKKLFKIGDVVTVDKDGIYDSKDLDFMKDYIGKKMFVINCSKADEDLYHYILVDEKCNVVLNKNGKFFPWIDADLKKFDKY